MPRDRVSAYRPKSTRSPFSPLRSCFGDPDPAEHLLRSLLGTRLHGENLPHLKADAQIGHCGHGTVKSHQQVCG